MILTEKPNMQRGLREVQSALITTDQYHNVCGGKTDDDESFAHQLKHTLTCVLITRQGFILHPHLYIYTYLLTVLEHHIYQSDQVLCLYNNKCAKCHCCFFTGNQVNEEIWFWLQLKPS